LKFIQLGKPQQNDFIERINRTYRHEVLNPHIFESLEQVREITEEWIQSYNQDHPNAALGKLAPIHYRQQAKKSALVVPTFLGGYYTGAGDIELGRRRKSDIPLSLMCSKISNLCAAERL